MKRKLLSLILVAAMLASMLVFAPTSGAATNTTANVAVTDATAKAGGTVSVDVIVTSEKLQSFDLGFKYDTTKLELVTHAQGGADLPAKVLGDFATDAVLSTKSDMGLVGVSSGVTIAVDASAGVTIATITFNVKGNAAPGDTYVEFVSTNGLFVNPTDEISDRITGDNLTNKAGKITILPAGYKEDTTKVLDDFASNDYEDCFDAEYADEPGTMVIYSYAGNIMEGDVVIPSELDGLPVVYIDYLAFDSAEFTSIQVPASVNYIEEFAFYNYSGVVYVLNPDCEIADYALGYEGGYKKGSPNNYSAIDGFTIYGYAGSTAEAYATANGFTFVEYAPAPTLTYTVGSDTYTYVVGNSTTAPGSAVVNGEVIVAWNDGVNNIAPGASMTIAGATTLAPVTIKAPATQNGADVKVGATADDFALRFTSKLAKADYSKLAELGTVNLGMLITPQKYVDYSTAFTKADLAAWVVSQGHAAKDAYVDVAITGYYAADEAEDGDYTLAASLQGFSGATRAKNPTFAAIAYAEIEIGNNVVTVYGSYDKACGRDAKTVLQALSNAGTLGTTQQGWLTALIGKFD